MCSGGKDWLSLLNATEKSGWFSTEERTSLTEQLRALLLTFKTLFQLTGRFVSVRLQEVRSEWEVKWRQQVLITLFRSLVLNRKGKYRMMAFREWQGQEKVLGMGRTMHLWMMARC